MSRNRRFIRPLSPSDLGSVNTVKVIKCSSASAELPVRLPPPSSSLPQFGKKMNLEFSRRALNEAKFDRGSVFADPSISHAIDSRGERGLSSRSPTPNARPAHRSAPDLRDDELCERVVIGFPHGGNPHAQHGHEYGPGLRRASHLFRLSLV